MDLRVATVTALDRLPGLVHGFEQRRGDGPVETRLEAHARVGGALEHAGRLHLMKQVHGARVVQAPFVGAPEADAAVTREPGVLLGIQTADCLPVLLVLPHRRAVAVAHAGWRGTAAGVVRNALGVLLAGGGQPTDVVAALGPGIGPCCYEVGGDVRDAFGPDADPLFRPGPRGRPHLDLRAANVQHLLDAGVPRHRIHHVDDCTSCRKDLYFSYRRDGPGTGRMISFVGFSA
jgi:YfiH family protein